MEGFCRTCANEHNLENGINLFNPNSRCKRLLSDLRRFMGLNLKKCGNMPDYICIDCQQRLEQAKEFRWICWQAQETLQYLSKCNVYMLKNVDKSLTQESDYAYDQEDDLSHSSENNQHVQSDSAAPQQEYLDDVVFDNTRLKRETLEIEIYNGTNKDSTRNTNLVKDEVDHFGFETIHFEANNSDSDCFFGESDQEFDEKSVEKHCHTYNNQKSKSIGSQMYEYKDEQPLPNKLRRKRTIRYICEMCGKDFVILQLFNAHVSRHKGELPFSCEICPAKFLAPRSLSRHMLKHSGILPYPCHYCERRFLDHNTRLRHERMHTNTRPFKCSFCSKAFTANIILKNHILTHTKERAFRCDLCQRSFLLKKHLHTHFKSNLHKQNEIKGNATVETQNDDKVLEVKLR